MKDFTIKNVTIGNGTPKICVPICASTKEELLLQIKEYDRDDIDFVEWRIDYFQNVSNVKAVETLAKKFRERLPDKPILFTFRSKQEGGEQALPLEDYFSLNLQLAKSGCVDLIDLELFATKDTTKLCSMVKELQRQNVKVILSNHDFYKTPEEEELLHRLKTMQQLGADVAKIAVMPNTSSDVLKLLSATNQMKEQYANIPIITMSMGKLGAISRISGEIFGSSVTFGSLKKASAPGQIAIADLKQALNLLS